MTTDDVEDQKNLTKETDTDKFRNKNTTWN